MNKHAYLIMVHKDDLVFRILIQMLDDERNDIFIHMDAKVKDFDENSVRKLLHHSGIYFIPRKDIKWGGYSQIDGELKLLTAASEEGLYDYFHLLSGQDLPIKSQDYIHEFFDLNRGKEYIDYFSLDFNNSERIRYYYFFREKIGMRNSLSYNFYCKLDAISIAFQKKIGVNRNKNVQFKKGANWFSITLDLASYVLERSDWIKTVFNKTIFCDEIFLQTIVYDSPFRNKLYYNKFDNNYRSVMRLIDWERGAPYVFKIDDWEQIATSDMLFARKFDPNVDMQIIEKIAKTYGKY